MGPINLSLLSFFLLFLKTCFSFKYRPWSWESWEVIKEKKVISQTESAATNEKIEIREKLLHLTGQGYYIEKV